VRANSKSVGFLDAIPEMILSGDDSKVLARVTRVEEYGVYFEFEGSSIFVLIPDVSYDLVPDLKARYKIGDVVRVRVFRYVEPYKAFKATIKDVDGVRLQGDW
jgi:predicted RNA-binding protein with RPS1 domain